MWRLIRNRTARADRSGHRRAILSSKCPPHTLLFVEDGEHEEQDSARLTVDERMLTIREPIHNVVHRIQAGIFEVPSVRKEKNDEENERCIVPDCNRNGLGWLHERSLHG
jgi:hypothetical protein